MYSNEWEQANNRSTRKDVAKARFEKRKHKKRKIRC